MQLSAEKLIEKKKDNETLQKIKFQLNFIP